MADRGRVPGPRIVVVEPARLAALTRARRELLACIRDPKLRERLDGELDVLAFRDGILAKVPEGITTLLCANDDRAEAAE